MRRHGLHFERFVWEALPAGGAHAGGIFGVEFADEDRSQVFDDLELDAFLERETRRLHAEKKLGTLNLTARKCGVTLPATPTDKITWQEVAACAWRRVRS